jgi:hypothetical protein
VSLNDGESQLFNARDDEKHGYHEQLFEDFQISYFLFELLL